MFLLIAIVQWFPVLIPLPWPDHGL